MIVISGALVLLALIFLIIGLAMSGLTLVYVSIGVSVVAGALLTLGVLSRRDGRSGGSAIYGGGGPALAGAGGFAVVEPTPGEAPVEQAADADAPVTRVLSAVTVTERPAPTMVNVVPGRPRYHAAGCRFLAKRTDATAVDVEQARADGYTACGVCHPDDVAEPTADDVAEQIAEAAPEPVAEAAPATEASPRRRSSAPAAAPIAAKAEPALRPARKAAAEPAGAPAAAATGRGPRSTVVVIPDRPKFHLAACRFVRDAEVTQSLTKGAAVRQGYEPCGVCKP